MVTKERLIAFKLDDRLLENLQKLSKRLNYNQSETVRLALERMIEQYLGVEASIFVVDKEKWNLIIKMLSEQIKEEIIQKVIKQVQKSPEIQKLIEAAKQGELEIEKP